MLYNFFIADIHCFSCKDDHIFKVQATVLVQKFSVKVTPKPSEYPLVVVKISASPCLLINASVN